MSQRDMSPERSRDPLHGITLEIILNRLLDHYGRERLGGLIAISCFNKDPSIKSSLRFLRKTPWARKKVETLYLRTRFQVRAEKPKKANGTDRQDK